MGSHEQAIMVLESQGVHVSVRVPKHFVTILVKHVMNILNMRAIKQNNSFHQLDMVLSVSIFVRF